MLGRRIRSETIDENTDNPKTMYKACNKPFASTCTNFAGHRNIHHNENDSEDLLDDEPPVQKRPEPRKKSGSEESCAQILKVRLSTKTQTTRRPCAKLVTSLLHLLMLPIITIYIIMRTTLKICSMMHLLFKTDQSLRNKRIRRELRQRSRLVPIQMKDYQPRKDQIRKRRNY